MSVERCAELLREGDPDRFATVLAAQPADRPALTTLYALNLEIARAPFASNEPLIAEMRLQWWIERLIEVDEGCLPPGHEVLSAFAGFWAGRAARLIPAADARRRDCERLGFSTLDEVIAHVDATAAPVMLLAAHRLGVDAAADQAIRDQARGMGIASFLLARPALARHGVHLDPGIDVASLAGQGIDALVRARNARRTVARTAAPALLPLPGARRVLADAARGGGVGRHEFARRAALAKLAIFGNWS